MHSLKTCLFVIPFSVIVSRNAATLPEIINVCRSTSGSGVEFNELHTVLFVCVFPSYSSIDAKKEEKTISVLIIFYQLVRQSQDVCDEKCLFESHLFRTTVIKMLPSQCEPKKIPLITVLNWFKDQSMHNRNSLSSFRRIFSL